MGGRSVRGAWYECFQPVLAVQRQLHPLGRTIPEDNTSASGLDLDQPSSRPVRSQRPLVKTAR
jgi:hypothetical protein